MDDAPPEVIFIVPYRDREPHKHFFSEYMNRVVMSDCVKNKDYAIYFVEQKDTRPFNRGAIKNIGFLAIKYKYPLHYQNITFVFNDVDTIPHKKNVLNYKTSHGTIKHFYGFTFALGGIFSITGADFERIGGFPNFWGWGCEDNCIYDRAIQHGVYVDRSTFFKIGDMNILHIYDGVVRNICRKEAYSAKMKSTTETVFTIRNLSFEYAVTNENGDNGVDIFYFDTQTSSGDVRIEEQNIVTERKIDLTPVIKERFGVNLHTNHKPMQAPQQFIPTRRPMPVIQNTNATQKRTVNMMMKPFMK
jgi:N-terminal region of glycosyl transferase group 7